MTEKFPASRLFVCVPGLRGRTDQPAWKHFMGTMQERVGGTWVGIDHGIGLYTRQTALAKAREIEALVDAETRRHANGCAGQTITLVGHSLGGVLVRAAYLISAGAMSKTMGAGTTWHQRVDRFVLLASMDAGINTESGRGRGFWLKHLGWLLVLSGGRLVPQLIKGGEFITLLRLSWIRHWKSLGVGGGHPVVVQVLGTADDEVDREDSIDPVLFPHALEVNIPGADHKGLHDLRSTENPMAHADLMARALTEVPPVRALATPKMWKAVVIALHGIRSSRFDWPDRLRKVFERKYPDIRFIAPDYGYFSALRFAIWGLHRKPVRWFYDQYTQVVVNAPNTPIHFVAHSNGTYVMGQAMLNVAAIGCDRCWFAGAVLPKSFDWPSLLGKQVNEVVNAYAPTDRVVAALCPFLRTALFRKTIGDAGYDKFSELNSGSQIHVASNHGASFTTAEKIEAIADFIATGASPAGLDLKKTSTLPDRLYRALSPWLVFLLLAGLLVFSVTAGGPLGFGVCLLAIVVLLHVL